MCRLMLLSIFQYIVVNITSLKPVFGKPKFPVHVLESIADADPDGVYKQRKTYPKLPGFRLRMPGICRT